MLHLVNYSMQPLPMVHEVALVLLAIAAFTMRDYVLLVQSFG
jgi:hypothetical protein